jgi:hypothetical protein
MFGMLLPTIGQYPGLDDLLDDHGGLRLEAQISLE